jgi:diphthamide synthase subunit DPH2
MQDIIKKGTQGIEDYFKEEAHIEALNNVGKIAEERINKIRDINLKQKFEIINKQEEFKKKMEKAAELGDKTAESRFKNYLTILDWMVNGDGAGNYS